jgi:hypothetical protein
MLSDLRSRNDELHRQNRALEEEMAALRERQRMLLQELSSPRGAEAREVQAPPPAAPAEYGAAAYQPSFQEPAVQEARAPEISIEMPVPDGGYAGGKPEATFEVPAAGTESPALGEADDLLAELEALENEMKNLGGEGQG